MVAISLYRGNLHRVPDVPRRWLMPTPKISLKDFKSLLSRRSKALSRHRSAATSSNPNPNSDPDQLSEAAKVGALNHEPKVKFEAPPEKIAADCEAGPSGEVKEKKRPDGDDFPAKDSDLALALKANLPEKGWQDSVAVKIEKVDQLEKENPNSEVKEDVLDEKQKRKREVEEKLQVLNQKKHNLVQVLKQILNAEEELKRRSSIQGIVVCPTVSLHVDVTNDSGSMNRQLTPRLGSDANMSGDMEGVEGDELSNHNFHPRHVLRMNSMSPSSESPLRRPAYVQHSAVPHPSRASLVATGTSPSRFAPSGHQGPPANLPTVSASGTNFVASSPSPAASGGTSTFRDARLPSPWN
ncbi:stress response protein NST1 [Rosa sericea]